MLISFAGLPGTGKSTIARSLAQALGAVWLRIDSIEQAIVEAQVLGDRVDGAGYAVAQRVALDNLLIGRTVIADSVNPWMLTRDSWRGVGEVAGVEVLEIETVCSDLAEHRRRIETRDDGVPGLRRLNWNEVIGRDYHAWTRERLVLDTAEQDAAWCIERVRLACSESVGATN